MTRTEERVKAMKEIQSSIDCDGLSCWQCRERAVGDGISWADKTMIERACDWLGKSTILADTTIERFKQAMEE